MKKQVWLVSLAIVMSLVVAGMAFAGPHGHKKPKKVGILLVTFGSTYPSAQAAFDNIDTEVKKAYPGIPVRWAYTSVMIRKKLAKKGEILDPPAIALAKMQEEDFTHVAVQSLHTIAGFEFRDLRRTVAGFKRMRGFEKIALGRPLLATQEDMERTVAAILNSIPKARKKNEAVVLMGHGSHHPANAFYAALMFQIQLKDPNIFIGTVEGYPGLDVLLPLLKEQRIKTAWLMPFMSVAGDHAVNDLAGDEDDSWKSILTKAGIRCETVLKGTAEFDEYVDIWVDHIKGPLSHF